MTQMGYSIYEAIPFALINHFKPTMILPNRILTIQNVFAFTLTALLSGMISCKDDDQPPAPQAISISPNTGFPGSIAVIHGSYFSSERADNVVTFNGKVASIVEATPQQLDVIVPEDADTGPVAIVVKVKGTVASSQLVYAVVPFSSNVASISPSKGGYNTDVSITGYNFRPVAADNIVTFNGIPVVVKTATEKQLTRPGNNAIRDCLRPKSDKFMQSRELACFPGAS